MEKMEKIQLKVGDLLSTSWGYDQTNVDFFQVVSLRGKTQCVIREVAKAPVGKYDENRKAVPNAFVKYSVFVKPEGSVKRIQYFGDNPEPYVNLSSFAIATLCTPEEALYETPSYQLR